MNQNLDVLISLLQAQDWTNESSDDYGRYKRWLNDQDAINQEQRRLIVEGLASVNEILEVTDKYRPKNT
jgi:hypothetical protein